MKYFIQIDADEYNEAINWLISEPLLLSVLLLCARRARKSEDPHPTLGLLQWEFLLSETEVAIFGLKSSQKGQIARSIMKLIQLGFISKTGKKTGNANSTIYLYNKDNPVTFGLQTGNDIGSKQGTNREPIGNEQGESYIDNKEIKEKSYKTVSLFEKDQLIIVARAKELYPDKNVDLAVVHYVSYCKRVKTKYKDFKLAFFDWVREDKFNKYGIKGVSSNGSVKADTSKYEGK